MPGVLTVHVIEASNLLNKDIMGKSDPYVEISFEETKVKSCTVTNNLSPQWNFISNFDVTGDDTSSIKFSVFDADYGKDQLLGSCSVSIRDALSELDSARWISLEGPESGKISIKFGFIENQDQNEEEEQKERAADSFINNVTEAEGRQKPTVESEKEEEQEETKADSKEEKAADSFVNDVSEAEGRQEPTVESENEEEQEETKGDSKEEKAADSFVNNVSEAEGRQEPSAEPDKEESPSQPEDEEQEEIMPGVLTVHVIEASNLKNKDIMGKSDPYVEILFEDTTVKSGTVNNSLSPQWNFISNFDVSGDDSSSIKFNVFDADYGKDQLLGSCSISIKDALSDLDSARWITLEGPESGKISIKFGFTEKQEDKEQEEANEITIEKASDSFVNDVSEAEG